MEEDGGAEDAADVWAGLDEGGRREGVGFEGGVEGDSR